MEKFKFLPDIATADIAFEAYGKTLNKLFQHAAEAVFTEMVDFSTVEPTITKKIAVEGETVEEALYNFLEELVFLKDAEYMVFSVFSVQVTEGKPVKVAARIKGEEIDTEKHKLGNDVKAVTMHMFQVKRVGNAYMARVIVDI